MEHFNQGKKNKEGEIKKNFSIQVIQTETN